MKTLLHLAGGILAALALAGCASTSAPLVVGERVRTVKPGEVFTVPALQPPARQWYFVDDIGLLQWLDIQAPGAK